MEIQNLSNYDLYVLIMDQSMKEDKLLAAEDEFKNRQLSFQEIDALSLKYEQAKRNVKPQELTTATKITLIIFPFFLLPHVFVSIQHLKTGHAEKWKQYWRFVALGHLFWTILVITIFRYLT
ncbi:hypothetical protein [Fulvivirga ligni]|uniref:hypothetical protein n=1 Tax=Fulvivirga ligni TaxID=2904246 RepID=UPI001F3A2AC7|nr:hypothetical protein [Fulvivirga ligni]UII21700.1 hypothetical protein LVD16_00415 [Fulvivirga ligni]